MVDLFNVGHVLGKVGPNEVDATKPRAEEMKRNDEYHVGGIVHAELKNRIWNIPTVYYVRWLLAQKIDNQSKKYCDA